MKIMRKSMASLLMGSIFCVAIGLVTTSARAADKQERDTLSDRIHAVNNAAEKSGNMKAALHSISVETGVPENQVEAMHKKYSDIGVAGVLMSCVMADETKKPSDYFMNKHKGGKSWTELAREHNVPLDKINTRLDHVEQSLAHSTSGSKERKQNKK